MSPLPYPVRVRSSHNSRFYSIRIPRGTLDWSLLASAEFPDDTNDVIYSANLVQSLLGPSGTRILRERVVFYDTSLREIGRWEAMYNPPVSLGPLESKLWMGLKTLTPIYKEELPPHLTASAMWDHDALFPSAEQLKERA